MSRLFIIEGMDSTGKSTLARYIARRCDGVLLHSSGKAALHQCMMEYHLDVIRQAKMNLEAPLSRSVVLDRSWPSEWAYGSVLRPEVYKSYNFEKVHEVLDPLNPIYIYCTRWDSYAIHRASHEDSDHLYGVEVYTRVSKKYDELFADIDHHKYDFDMYCNHMDKFYELL